MCFWGGLCMQFNYISIEIMAEVEKSWPMHVICICICSISSVNDYNHMVFCMHLSQHWCVMGGRDRWGRLLRDSLRGTGATLTETSEKPLMVQRLHNVLEQVSKASGPDEVLGEAVSSYRPGALAAPILTCLIAPHHQVNIWHICLALLCQAFIWNQKWREIGLATAPDSKLGRR